MADFPSSIRIPGTYGLTDDTLANTASGAPRPIYLLAEYTSLASGYAANTAYLVGSAAEVAEIAGAGSNLARMAVAYFAGRPSGVAVYVVPVAEAAGGTKATGKITATGTATADGTHVIRIAGQDVYVDVTTGDSPTDVGNAITAAVTALTTGPVTCSNALGVATLTARNKGLYGNYIRIELDPDGAPDDGVTLTLTNPMGGLAAGAGVADCSSALSAIAAAQWDILCMFQPDSDPYADCDAIMNDTTGRWSYNKRLDGHVVNPMPSPLADLITWADEFSTFPWMTVHAIEGVAAGTNHLGNTPPWELAGAITAAMGTWRIGDTSRACEDRALVESTDWHCLPPAEASRFDFDDRTALINVGYATLACDPSGKLRLETSRTTQTETTGGAPTNAYEQYRTRVILSDFGATQRARIKSQFQTGGARPSTAVTRRAMKATLATVYREFCDDERMDVDSFAAYCSTVSVERNGTVANRVDIVDQPQVTGTASIVTIRNSFRLL